jgi:cysteine desulfuration protein SufE
MMYEAGSWPIRLQQIIDEFSEVDDSMERIEMLFEYAQGIDELPMSEWCDDTKVHGCQSEAHVLPMQNDDGTFHLMGASDAKLVQGLMAITAIALEGLAPSEVAIFSSDYASEMGLMNALTPSRANGFRNMFRKVVLAAQEMGE